LDDNKKPDSVPDQFAQRAVKIADLEAQIVELKKEQEQQRETVLRLMEEAGENLKTRYGTIYIHRSVVVQPANNPEQACLVLQNAGLGKFVSRRIVNEKELARYIDENNLASRIAHGIKVLEIFNLRVRKVKSHE
jgi:hypothetical protein